MKMKKDYDRPEISVSYQKMQDVLVLSPNAEPDPFGEGTPWAQGGN